MTNREFFESIVATESLDQEIRDHAQHSLEMLDAKAGADEARKAEKRAANEEVVMEIEALLAGATEDNPMTISDLYEACEGKYSRQKMQTVIRLYAADHIASTPVVKDKRQVKGYYLA